MPSVLRRIHWRGDTMAMLASVQLSPPLTCIGPFSYPPEEVERKEGEAGA
jgi:hypothetical protein